MADELDVIEEWIATTLAGDAQLEALAPGITSRVYRRRAPQSSGGIATVFPYIVFQLQGSFGDLHPMNEASKRVWADVLILIRVVGENVQWSELSPLVNRIDALLDRKPAPAPQQMTNGKLVSCSRLDPYEEEEPPVGSSIYRHLGGFYRIRATPQ